MSAVSRIKDDITSYFDKDIKDAQLAINKACSVADINSIEVLVKYLDFLDDKLENILSLEGEAFGEELRKYIDKQYKVHQELSGVELTDAGATMLFSGDPYSLKQKVQEKLDKIRKLRNNVLPKL